MTDDWLSEMGKSMARHGEEREARRKAFSDWLEAKTPLVFVK